MGNQLPVPLRSMLLTFQMNRSEQIKKAQFPKLQSNRINFGQPIKVFLMTFAKSIGK